MVRTLADSAAGVTAVRRLDVEARRRLRVGSGRAQAGLGLRIGRGCTEARHRHATVTGIAGVARIDRGFETGLGARAFGLATAGRDAHARDRGGEKPSPSRENRSPRVVRHD
jgi:hypothetical protein